MADLPQSNALEEAGLDSLSVLMSRDPEGYSRQDRNRIIEALRAHRSRWEKAELEGTRRKSPRALKASEALQLEAPDKTTGGLGL